MSQPRAVWVIRPSHYFTPGQAYPVQRWHDDVPRVRNDAGSFTWLVEPRTWEPVPESALPRWDDALRAKWRAERARVEHASDASP